MLTDTGRGLWCSGPSSMACTVDECPTCPKTCNGETCEFWVQNGRARSCEDLETNQGCDCRGCNNCASSKDGQQMWSEWTACSATCGSGVQGRGTKVLKPVIGTGVMLPPPGGKRVRTCHRKACSSCSDPACRESEFCIHCEAYASCTSCNAGCKLRKVDSDGHHDCKAVGDWGPPVRISDDDPVVVHGRKLRGQRV